MAPIFRATGTAAFDGLYRRHAATVYRYCLAVLGNHADAEDATQTTFMNAYRALAQGVKPRKAENWLLTIAHNQIRQHFRRTLAKPLEVELDEAATGTLEPDDRYEPSVADVLRALQRLTPGQRSAIVMREFEGRSYAEMAEILGLTSSALEALLFRARRALAEELEESLTCDEAERSLSRRLDGRLARREARRLKVHMRECPHCRRFEQTQKRQRKALKGLSLMPVPVSLFLLRGESAAAAGLGAAGAAGAAGTGALGGAAGASVAAGLATGVTAKVAAVTAVAAVAVGGAGYGVTKVQGPSKVDRAAALAQVRKGARAEQVEAAKARGERPGPAATASDRARIATAAAHDTTPANARASARHAVLAARKLARTPPRRSTGNAVSRREAAPGKTAVAPGRTREKAGPQKPPTAGQKPTTAGQKSAAEPQRPATVVQKRAGTRTTPPTAGPRPPTAGPRQPAASEEPATGPGTGRGATARSADPPGRAAQK